MLKSYKFRIYPNKTQVKKLEQTFGCCRFVWNQYVEMFNNGEKLKSITKLKKEFVFLNDISSIALQQVERNVHKTLTQFFNKERKVKLGRPNFKNKRSKQSFSISEHGYHMYDRHIHIARVGKVKIVYDREIDERAKYFHATITKTKTNKYYVSIHVDEPMGKNYIRTNKSIGIDLGISHFATLSNGIVLDSPRFISENQAKIKRLQRFLAKKKKDSVRYRKLKLRIAKIYESITNKRNLFIHEFTTWLVRNYDLICIEDLDVESMKQSKFSKSLVNVCFAEFRRQLTYKCQWKQKILVPVDRWFKSSKKCSCCGNVKQTLSISERTYVCSNCGTVIDRDLNAAINIHALGFNSALRTLSTEVTKYDEVFTRIKETR